MVDLLGSLLVVSTIRASWRALPMTFGPDYLIIILLERLRRLKSCRVSSEISPRVVNGQGCFSDS